MAAAVNHKHMVFLVLLLFLPGSCWTHTEETPMNRTLLFFGDSITEGFRLPERDSFPAIIQTYLQRDGLQFQTRNGGRSGDTTADARLRLPYVLETEIPDVVVIELGYNDAFAGMDPEETEENLVSIIEGFRRANPEIQIYLCDLRIFMNAPEGFKRRFALIFTTVSQQTGVPLLGDPMESISSRPGLFQSDGVHPTSTGMKLVADDLYGSLKPILKNIK